MDGEALDPLDGMGICECCEGSFLPEDMDGEHCAECASSLFDLND